MFRNQPIMRTISTVVLIAFTNLALYPVIAEAQTANAMEKAGLLPKPKDQSVADSVKSYLKALSGKKASMTGSADERMGQLLGDIHEHLKATVPQTAFPAMQKMAAAKAAPSDAIAAAHVKAIRNNAAEVRSLYADIDQSFADTEQRLKDARLPQEILDRHHQAVAQYADRKAQFERLMGKVESAADSGNASDQHMALAGLGLFMAQYPNAKPHQYTNPNKLPFGTNSGKVRAPNVSKAQYQASLFPVKYQKVMLASLTLDGIKIAQATLPNTPNAADLAATDDVQLTPAIQAQAAALGKNPVAIYNWVRNNVKFIPSYGSIQGSDMTLQNLQGNDIDTASLLIALYRASGIPARYAYATIDVPAAKVENWVGGVTTPEAALSLLGQGGVPSIGIQAGGAIATIRMEHVYVEAFVDMHPSGGAINRNPATWVPVDASFKQYQFTKGMDLKTNVPIDAQAMLTQIQQGATVDTTNGYVQNLNQANLQTQMTAYQSQVQNYITAQKANATVGDVLGTQTIVAEKHAMLLGSLPYSTVAIGNTFQTLPDNLRWKFKTNIYPADGIGDSSTPLIEINQNTAALAGKKITLSFTPATAADQALVNSYLPKPHADGTPIQPSELPTSLPGYLLNMKAELRIEGQIAAQTTGSFTMGSDVRQSNQYFNPATGAWDGGEDAVVTVGEYDAIGMDLQGIGATQLSNFQVKLDATKEKLSQYQQNPNDVTPINGLTKEDLTGDIIQSGIVGYFAQVDTSDRIIARAVGNVQTYRLPSYGRFLTAAQPQYFFGVVRSVTFPGAVLDVGYLRYHVAGNDGDPMTSMLFMRQAGAASSSAENAVPERMFRNPNIADNDPAQPQGVSAVKILAIAAVQGQKIYTFNQNNQAQQSTILQGLQISQDVKSEIVNALATGKEVEVHEKDITVNGWTGSGYIIVDPTAGAGAYKIAGGANGGAIDNSYIGRYLAWVSSNLITTSSPEVEALILLVTPVMKYWFGFSPLLGSTNPATSLIRALSLMLRAEVGFGIPFAAGIGRLLWPVAFFIGIYNVTILLEGFLYARRENGNRMNQFVLLSRGRDEIS